MNERFPSEVACDLKVTGNAIAGDEQQNLVCKAYNLLVRDHTYLGFNYRMSELNAALGAAQMSRIETLLANWERVAG